MDSITQLLKSKKVAKESSKGKSHREIKEDKLKSKSKKHVAFESQPDILTDTCFESHTIVVPGSKLEESDMPVVADKVLDSVSLLQSEDSSDEVIPEDVSLPSQFLMPNLDEEIEITELNPEAVIHNIDKEEEMPSVNSVVTS